MLETCEDLESMDDLFSLSNIMRIISKLGLDYALLIKSFKNILITTIPGFVFFLISLPERNEYL